MDTRLTRRTVLGVLGVGPLGVARAAVTGADHFEDQHFHALPFKPRLTRWRLC